VFDIIRKYLLAFPHSKVELAPFASWNCLTIRMKDKDIDIMIKKESHLRALIKFLIFSLKTMDGTPNTFGAPNKNLAALAHSGPRKSRKSKKSFLPTLNALKKLDEP